MESMNLERQHRDRNSVTSLLLYIEGSVWLLRWCIFVHGRWGKMCDLAQQVLQAGATQDVWKQLWRKRYFRWEVEAFISVEISPLPQSCLSISVQRWSPRWLLI